MIFVPLYLCLIVCCPTTQVFKATPNSKNVLSIHDANS